MYVVTWIISDKDTFIKKMKFSQNFLTVIFVSTYQDEKHDNHPMVKLNVQILGCWNHQIIIFLSYGVIVVYFGALKITQKSQNFYFWFNTTSIMGPIYHFVWPILIVQVLISHMIRFYTFLFVKRANLAQ